MTLSEPIRKLFDKYLIRLLGTDRKTVLATPVYEWFSDPTDKNIGVSSVDYKTEPLITVELPLSRLEALAQMEAIFYNNIEDVTRRRVFERWLTQQNEEHALRELYPAVAKAYQQYSAMLTWCGQTRRKITDNPPENT